MEKQNQTPGQKLVGVSFNPSQDSKVDRIKEKAAALLDEVLEQAKENGTPKVAGKFYDKAIESIITGQMFAVKAATWKD